MLLLVIVFKVPVKTSINKFHVAFLSSCQAFLDTISGDLSKKVRKLTFSVAKNCLLKTVLRHDEKKYPVS